jgi:LTXXQ motif family protein
MFFALSPSMGEGAMKSIKMSAAAALVIAAAIFGPANAQDQSQQQDPWNGWMMMGPRGMMGYGGPGSWMMGQGGFNQATCNVMANHIEGRLAYIKAELKITEAQGSLWNAYADAARDNANAMQLHHHDEQAQRVRGEPARPT